jgi:hypothetical protein
MAIEMAQAQADFPSGTTGALPKFYALAISGIQCPVG